jgi:predicted nucleic-acid-binding Zn-ribbon protein
MSTKNVRTIGDVFRFKCGLKAECRRCGYTQNFDGAYPVSCLRDGQMSLRALQHRLKCSQCGAKNAKVEVLSPPPPRH